VESFLSAFLKNESPMSSTRYRECMGELVARVGPGTLLQDVDLTAVEKLRDEWQSRADWYIPEAALRFFTAYCRGRGRPLGAPGSSGD
jgi:hypothetical protein